MELVQAETSKDLRNILPQMSTSPLSQCLVSNKDYVKPVEPSSTQTELPTNVSCMKMDKCSKGDLLDETYKGSGGVNDYPIESNLESTVPTESVGQNSSKACNAVRGLLTSVLKMDLGEILRKGRGRQKKSENIAADNGQNRDSSNSWSRDRDSGSGSPRGFLRSLKGHDWDKSRLRIRHKKPGDDSNVKKIKKRAKPLQLVNKGKAGEVNELGKIAVKTCKKRRAGAAFKFSTARRLKAIRKNRALLLMRAEEDEGATTECDWHTEAEETYETSENNSEIEATKEDPPVYIPQKEVENKGGLVDGVVKKKVRKIARWPMTRKRRSRKKKNVKKQDSLVTTSPQDEETAKVMAKEKQKPNVELPTAKRQSARKQVPKTPFDLLTDNANSSSSRVKNNKNLTSADAMCGTEELKRKFAMSAFIENPVSSDGHLVNGSMRGRPRFKRKRDDSESVSSSRSAGSETSHYVKRIAVNADQLPSCKVHPTMNGISLEPKVISYAPNDFPQSTMVAPVPLCTCRSASGARKPEDDGDNCCQAVDCMDSHSFGCCNTAASRDLFRPALRLPFQALCEVHRQRLRLHHCCPGCGLFCTQGNFVQCRSDPRKAIHHAHRECLLVKDEQPMCPHCGMSSHLTEVHLELNTPRSAAYYLKPRLVERTANRPAARMTFVRGPEQKAAEPVDSKSYRIMSSGREISTVGLAVGADRTELEELLVKLPRKKPQHVNYNERHMFNASKVGDVQIILHALILGFDPSTKFACMYDQTALHVSAASGKLLNVHVLYQAGAPLDAIDSLQQTPLMLSVEKRRNDIVRYLLKAGAEIEIRGEDGMTVLHLAAKCGNYDACRMILNTGKMNVNVQDDGGWTALVWAAEHRHIPIAKLLLERGANPNLTDNEKNVALHWAAFSGSAEIAEILLDHGCDINSINIHGDTPLHTTARRDFYECTWLFLSRKANTQARNKDNETPIMCCPVVDSQTYISLSLNEEFSKCNSNQTAQPEIILHRDISRGKEANPIQCVNGTDKEGYPKDFIYMMETCETSAINIDRVVTSLQNCLCEDDCSSSNCMCSSISLKCWYDKEHRLLEDFLQFDPPMLFECNRKCLCWKTCRNRSIQHGIMCRLQLFRTDGKGWGVRTLRDIPQGTFVCEYIGEIITDLEADEREDDSYLFDLDNRDGETYCLDARNYGNISRFVNHLCEPNVVSVKFFVDHQDLRFPRIAFFSSRDIKAYEELGFDYGEKFWAIKHKYFTCKCDSSKCKYSAETIQETLENYNRRLREEHDAKVQKHSRM